MLDKRGQDNNVSLFYPLRAAAHRIKPFPEIRALNIRAHRNKFYIEPAKRFAQFVTTLAPDGRGRENDHRFTLVFYPGLFRFRHFPIEQLGLVRK